jgi:hypothetical protein
MNKRYSAAILSALLVGSSFAFAGAVYAEKVSMVGTISKITLAPDGKTAAAVLKDVKSGKAVTINISDDLTLDKFKDKRIVEGDEIRTRFDDADGKNKSKSFKKTAGC